MLYHLLFHKPAIMTPSHPCLLKLLYSLAENVITGSVLQPPHVSLANMTPPPFVLVSYYVHTLHDARVHCCRGTLWQLLILVSYSYANQSLSETCLQI